MSGEKECLLIDLLIYGFMIYLQLLYILHFFPLLIFFKKYVAFCTRFNLLTPIFMLPYIIMDLPIFMRKVAKIVRVNLEKKSSE